MVILPARCQAFAVRGDGETLYRVPGLKYALRFSRPGIPEADRVVGAARDQSLPIRSEDDGVAHLLVTGNSELLLEVLGIPDVDPPLVVAQSERLPVGREGDAADEV